MKAPKKITIRELADDAGVSVTTVSYVLNNRGSIGQAVRERVLEAADRLGYKQNRAARAMKTGKSQLIGLVLPNLENPFFSRLSKSVFDAAQERGYLVFLAGTEGQVDQQKSAIDSMSQQGIDGMIIFPVDESVRISQDDVKCPFVSLDRRLPNVNTIFADCYQGGRLIGEHLLETGHTQVGLVNGPSDVSSSRDRIRGFKDVVKGRIDIIWETENPYTHELKPDVRKQIQKNQVSAIVCGNDQIAMGVLTYCQHLKIDVPGDVSIVGFDDIPFTEMVRPALTTVRMPTAEMGRAAVDQLLSLLEEGNKDKAAITECLSVDLIVR